MQRRRRDEGPDRDWEDDGACRGMTPALFYPPEGTGGRGAGSDVYRNAREVCHACPVIAECREYALTTREPYGMWGGLTPAERRAIMAARGRRTPVALPEPAGCQ